MDIMEEIFTKIEQRLMLPLPGQEAQKLMMPTSGHSMDRFSIEVKKGAKEGGVLLLLYPKNKKIYFALTQRHTYNGAHSGQISFPGGKVEAADATIIDTALRETEEEIGVPSKNIRVIGRLTDLYIIASHFNVRPVVGVATTQPAFNLDAREVSQLIEVSLQELLNDNLVEEKELIVRNHIINTPFFNFNGFHVWGATAMMLAEFKEIVKVVGS